MALALAVTDHWDDGKRIHVFGTVTASGSYTTNGDTLNLGLALIKSNSVPTYVCFMNGSKYMLKYITGTTIANGKMKIIVPDTGNELSQAGYPAAITGDSISFYAIFPKFF